MAALLQAAGDALWTRLGPVAVAGELSGLSRAASGHWYFSLKDDAGAPALLRCAMFRRAAMLVDFVPADGQRVELRGRLDLYAARGELQLVAESMQRVGQGTLYEEFLRLRARLQAQGLFDAARKRALPVLPRRLGVVTSLDAAALRDVLSALQRRSPQVAIVVYPCLVQGPEAPASIVQALATVAARAEVEALLLVRGGGSLEDLWAFNDERVVRAIVASPLPVVCGVGHETDVTLADLAADLRAATPTAAAELAVPHREELLVALAKCESRLLRATQQRLQAEAQGLDLRHAHLRQPARLLLGQNQRLQALVHRLARAPRPALAAARYGLTSRADRMLATMALQRQHHQQRLHGLAARLPLLDPQRVLDRGYALVQTPGGAVLRSAAQLIVGQTYRVRLADGAADVVPERVTPLPSSD